MRGPWDVIQQTLRRVKKSEPMEERSSEQSVNFIMDEGTGCVDNGCSKGIIGKDTLEVYKNRWHATGGVPVDFEIQKGPILHHLQIRE